VLCRVLLFTFPLFLLADTPPVYTIQTVAGTSFVGDGGAATAAILSQPEGIAVDATGNIYFADADSNRVRKIAPDGTIQTVAGTGLAGFSGDGGPAASAQLNQPYGLALDAAGDLYIADLGNGRVRRIALDGTISTVAKLTAPRNVAFDSAGNLYISDFGANQVYVMPPGESMTLFAGSGTAGSSGDGGAASVAELSAPAGLACDAAGDVYIADSGNGRLRVVTNGVINTAFSIPSPTGLAINSAGTLYIAAAGYFGTTTMAVGADITARDVAADASGNLYVTTGSLVQELTVAGTIETIAGNGASFYYGGDGGPAFMSRLHTPSAIVLDDLGNAYIADTANQRIREILANGTMTTLAGTGDAGSSDGGGVAMLAQFSSPQGLALDSLRNLYVADTGNNRVCKITTAGVFSVIASQLNGPLAVAVDSGGNVYIADTGNDQVLQLSPAGTSTMVGQAIQPAGLALDAAGTLYVSEADRISEIPRGGTVATVLGGLDHPSGLAVTASGDLAVAETGTERVLLIQGGMATPIAGTGIAGFSGDGGPALAAALNAPSGVAIDGHGVLWIADSGNQRIRTLTPTKPSTQVLSSVSVVNAASLAGGSVAAGEIVSIFGSGFDPAQTQVLFGQNPATLFYVAPDQINALVPALTAGAASEMTVVVDGAAASEQQLTVVAAVPGLFLANASTGQVAAINQDGSDNSATHPAARGSYVSLFATGWSAASLPVTINIGGYNASVVYAGPAPGFAGLMQINAQVPGGFLGPGMQSVTLTVGSAQSQSGATIALQ
jgi:uncharacterized protein (TIGR03437 family)